jgi:hypothetical protein
MQIYRLMELGELVPTVSLMRFFWLQECHADLQAHGAGGTCPNGESHERLSGSKRGMQLYRLMELGELVPTVGLMRFSLAPRGACSSSGNGGHEQLISIGEMFKPAFAGRDNDRSPRNLNKLV